MPATAIVFVGQLSHFVAIQKTNSEKLVILAYLNINPVKCFAFYDF